MNRVLGLPTRYFDISLLHTLRQKRSRAMVTEQGGVCSVTLQHGRHSVDMPFADQEQALPAGTSVYVWYHLGGFVCDSCDAIDSEESMVRNLEQRVAAMRQHIEASREQRKQRHEKAQKEAATRAATQAEATAPDRVETGGFLRL